MTLAAHSATTPEQAAARRDARRGLWLAAPAVLWCVVFFVLPFATMLVWSFHTGAPGEGPATLDNYRRVFSVIFAPGAKPIEAKPMGRPELSTEPNPYVATVRLVTVAA